MSREFWAAILFRWARASLRSSGVKSDARPLFLGLDGPGMGVWAGEGTSMSSLMGMGEEAADEGDGNESAAGSTKAEGLSAI